MIELVNKTMGFELPLQVASTSGEYDNLAKREGACVEAAVKQYVYHRWNTAFRSAFSEALEKETKVARKVKPGDKEGTEVWAESEPEHFARACAELGRDKASFASLAQTVAATLPFNPSVTEREPSSGPSIAKMDLRVAEQVTAAGGAEKVAAALSKLLGKTVTADLEGLAAGIREKRKLDEAESLKKLMNM